MVTPVSSANASQSAQATQALTATPAAGPLSKLPVSTTGSALLGTGGATTVLGALNSDAGASLFGNISTTQSALFQQIESNANAQLSAKLKAINDAAADTNTALNNQNDRWVTVRAQVNNAQTYVSNGQDAAKKVQATLLQMRTSVANIGTPGQDPKTWKDTFDTQVNSVNIQAELGGPSSNLVGDLNPVDFSPNKIEYRSDLGAGATTLTGTYIGTTFRITSDTGEVWVPDTSDTLQAYKGLQGDPESYTTGDGQKVRKATSTRNGLKLVSYDPATHRITVNISVVPTDPPIVVTGKLQTTGIGIMQSWFYNGLASKADRDRAFADINKSEVNIVSAQADLQRSATQTSRDQNRLTSVLNQLTAQANKNNQQQQAQLQATQIKAAQQYLAMKANLQNLQSVQANYLDAFSGFVTDPFARASLKLTT